MISSRNVVDVNTVAPYCKPMPESFAIAMDLADEPDPRKCVMIDDLPRTTRAALNVGMASLLYGCDEPTQMPVELLPIGLTCPFSWGLSNMESNQAAIGLLIIILLIVGVNFVMYAIARGAAKGEFALDVCTKRLTEQTHGHSSK